MSRKIAIEIVTAVVYSDSTNKSQPHVFPSYPTTEDEDGYLQINARLDGNNYKTFRFPLISIWPNQVKSDQTNIAKATAFVPTAPKHGFVLLPDRYPDSQKPDRYPDSQKPTEKEHVDFINTLWTEPGGIDRNGSPEMKLSIDQRKNVLRWGCVDPPYRAQDDGNEIVPIFDNKSKAVEGLLDVIKKMRAKTVAGIDVLNLNCVSDSLLEEMGMFKVKDLLGRGIAMWQGDPVSIISGGTSSFSFRYSMNQQASKEVVESFVTLLEKEFS